MSFFLYNSERVNDLSLTPKANDPEIFIVFNKNIFRNEQDPAYTSILKLVEFKTLLKSVLSLKKLSKKLPLQLKDYPGEYFCKNII